MHLGERERVLARLVERHIREVDRLALVLDNLVLRGLGLRVRVARQVVRHTQVAGGDLLLCLFRGGQRERERLLRALNTGDLLRHLRGQLVAGV